MAPVRLAMAQTNPVVGDVSGNLNQIIERIDLALEADANIVVFPEMALSGYPIEDLAQNEHFLTSNERAIGELATHLTQGKYEGIAVVVGHAACAPSDKSSWATAQNAATVIVNGRVLGRYAKRHLPNYSVFDEYRNFVPGQTSLDFEFEGLRFGVLICEDIWQAGRAVTGLSAQKVDIALVLNGSPFEQSKDDTRLALVQTLAREHDCAVVYVNLVGGQDDLVFDGGSFATLADGSLIARYPQFIEHLELIEFESKNAAKAQKPLSDELETENQIWSALVTGLRDYVEKNQFRGVVLGLSGGIDSAVCAALATDALGADRVFGVTMPSDYSSVHSITDALDLGKRLGIAVRNEPISALVAGFEHQLGLVGLSAENVQARVRGVILMGISNQEGLLVLSTGNKTEISVGYSTIYGDTVGGFAPIKDVPKTLVWELARWRNQRAESNGVEAPIPHNSITKAPSAELRPGQLDQDSLPPYDLLDTVLHELVEMKRDVDSLVAQGFDRAVVNHVAKLVKASEWKRKQGAIGTKISPLAFGRDRRMPITNRYEG